MNMNTPIPISSPEAQRAHLPYDELLPLGRSRGASERLGGGRDDPSAGAGDDHRGGPSRVRGGHEGCVERALTDAVGRLRDRRDRPDVERVAGRLLEAGAQRRRLRRRPHDTDLDAVGLRLVVGADDAERKPDHEEDRDEHGSEGELRLRALVFLGGGVGGSVLGHGVGVVVGLVRSGVGCRRRPRRTSYTLSGSVAGPLITAPVVTSNREPWHWHISVVPVSRPPDSGHDRSAQVQRSSNA